MELKGYRLAISIVLLTTMVKLCSIIGLCALYKNTYKARTTTSVLFKKA